LTILGETINCAFGKRRFGTMKRTKSVVCPLAAFLCLLPAAGFGYETLTLGDYLKKVRTNNPEIKSIELSIDAMGKKVLELDMAYSPYLSGGYNYTDDKSGPGFGSTLLTKEMTANSWTVNASKKFGFGSTVSLGYSSMDARFDLLTPTAIIGPALLSDFAGYQIKPFARIEQSLLRDINSGLTRSGIEKARASVRAGQYMQLFRKQQILMRARTAYWGLSLARDVSAFRTVSLDRTEKLLRWNENRLGLDLADRSDFLQSQAAFKLRQLNLQMAREDEVKAASDFNELLGLPDDTVDYELEKLSDKLALYKGMTLNRSGERADVLSARETFTGSQWAERETKYRAMPELTLAGSWSLTGLGLSYSDTWSQVAGAEKPTLTLGINFVVPLDYRTLETVKEGYRRDFASSAAALQKTELSARKDWLKTTRSWNDVKTRLALAQEIKDIQEQRVANEQERFRKGRTTTFLLLNAENDLDDATLNVYRLVFEAIATDAQADLYNTQKTY